MHPTEPAADTRLAEHLSTPRPVPWGGAVARVRASVRPRRLVPTPLAFAVTDVFFNTMYRIGAERRASSLAAMEAIAGGVVPDSELTRLARRHHAVTGRRWEWTFRPKEHGTIPVFGADNLADARATGRGVIISFTHLGPLVAWESVVQIAGPVHLVLGDWLDEPPRPGYEGYQVEQRRKLYASGGFTMMLAKGSAARIRRILENAGTVQMALDLPGRRKTEFLGKVAEMSDGTARLAALTKALIVPAAHVPAGQRWAMQIGEPVDPIDYASVAELHQDLATLHSRIILGSPDHYESPLRPGGWARADRTGWWRT